MASKWRAAPRLRLVIDADDVPLLAQAAVLAQQGFVTGASHRNWSSYGSDVAVPAEMPEWRRHLLTDPQTSGGLLVAVAPERGAAVLADDPRPPAVPSPASSDMRKRALPRSRSRPDRRALTSSCKRCRRRERRAARTHLFTHPGDVTTHAHAHARARYEIRGVGIFGAWIVFDLDQYAPAAAKVSLLNFSARRRCARHRLVRSVLESEITACSHLFAIFEPHWTSLAMVQPA